MKIAQFIRDNAYYVNDAIKSCGNVFIQFGHFFSYGGHYPLAVLINGTYFINDSGYSSSTKRHINIAKDVIVNTYLWDYSSVSKDITNGHISWSDEKAVMKMVKSAIDDELGKVCYKLLNTKARAFKQISNLELRKTELEKSLAYLKY